MIIIIIIIIINIKAIICNFLRTFVIKGFLQHMGKT